MKKNLRLAGLFLALFVATYTNAQSNASKTTSPPSDASSGYTYDFNKVRDLIIERINAPSKNNADVKVFLDQKDFPLLTANKIIDAAFKDKLRIWMEKNPSLIINTLKSRKDIVTQY